MALRTWTQKAATRATASGRTGVTGAAGPALAGGAARRWWVLAVASVAQLMVVLDVSVVNIALPSAQRALAFSDADRQWVVTAYSLAFGSLLLIGGKLSDLLGRDRTFAVGLAGFAGASALAGAAPNFAVLAAGRIAVAARQPGRGRADAGHPRRRPGPVRRYLRRRHGGLAAAPRPAATRPRDVAAPPPAGQ